MTVYTYTDHFQYIYWMKNDTNRHTNVKDVRRMDIVKIVRRNRMQRQRKDQKKWKDTLVALCPFEVDLVKLAWKTHVTVCVTGYSASQ